MYNNNGQWPGHGQRETAEIFRELVEVMPELPIAKLVDHTKTALLKLKAMASKVNTEASVMPRSATEPPQESAC